MIPLPTNIKAIAIGVVLITTFVAGWKTNGWRHDAEYKRKLEKIIAQANVNDAKNRVIISELQTKKQQIVTKEVVRYAKIKDVTDNRVCFANWDAIRLWNDALNGHEPMPENPTGTAHAPGITFATDTEVLENLNANAAKWEKLREQVSKIIEWDAQTFGEKAK